MGILESIRNAWERLGRRGRAAAITTLAAGTLGTALADENTRIDTYALETTKPQKTYVAEGGALNGEQPGVVVLREDGCITLRDIGNEELDMRLQAAGPDNEYGTNDDIFFPPRPQDGGGPARQPGEPLCLEDALRDGKPLFPAGTKARVTVLEESNNLIWASDAKELDIVPAPQAERPADRGPAAPAATPTPATTPTRPAATTPVAPASREERPTAGYRFEVGIGSLTNTTEWTMQCGDTTRHGEQEGSGNTFYAALRGMTPRTLFQIDVETGSIDYENAFFEPDVSTSRSNITGRLLYTLNEGAFRIGLTGDVNVSSGSLTVEDPFGGSTEFSNGNAYAAGVALGHAPEGHNDAFFYVIGKVAQENSRVSIGPGLDSSDSVTKGLLTIMAQSDPTKSVYGRLRATVGQSLGDDVETSDLRIVGLLGYQGEKYGASLRAMYSSRESSLHGDSVTSTDASITGAGSIRW